MEYSAKCKHCIFAKYKSTYKKNGEKSRKHQLVCTNESSKMYSENITLKTPSCEKIEL